MRRSGAFLAALTGFALIAAPVVLGLFSSSAAGAKMMGDFEPFMKARVIDGFDADLATVDRAAESSREVLPHFQHHSGVTPQEFDKKYPAVAAFAEEWPAISADMRTGMLGSMRVAISDLEAIGAVPPIGAMPYAIAGLGAVALALGLWARKKRGGGIALLTLGLMIVVVMTAIGAVDKADRAESMFGRMRPFMTHSFMTDMQQRFLTVGAAEGAFRNQLIPDLQKAPGSKATLEDVRAMVRLWPHMAGDMAPMMGAMSDNIDNFDSVSTMPRFPYFVAGFFVVGGALVLSGLFTLVPETKPRKRLAASVAALMLLGVGCGSSADASSKTSGENLEGLFKTVAGSCKGGKTTGSWMRMVQPKGTMDKGPFVENADSNCADLTYTLMTPGTDGGLITGEYQAEPDPAFDKNGNALADRIMQPLSFYAVQYSVAYDRVDPQTGTRVDPPTLTIGDDGSLQGELPGWSVSWNKQNFNQGAPKPDGSTPGLTTGPSGTYDEKTGHFTLEWASEVTGGPFDGFTGFWHLEGVFEPR
ncbi:MAG TPA: hypothetical protein VFK89_02105 [Actinomycetota bacterium]|nr:hypothetical protein [Actinomycetota bacterium]